MEQETKKRARSLTIDAEIESNVIQRDESQHSSGAASIKIPDTSAVWSESAAQQHSSSVSGEILTDMMAGEDMDMDTVDPSPPCTTMQRRRHRQNNYLSGGEKDAHNPSYENEHSSKWTNSSTTASMSSKDTTSNVQYNVAIEEPHASSFQDLNHDILSIIYTFIHEPCLDSAYLLEEEDEIHLGHLFLNVALVSKDLRQSCIHHAQREPIVLRFEDNASSSTQNDEDSHDSFPDARKKRDPHFFSSILRWTSIVRPKVSVIVQDLQDFDSALICMDIIRHCDLAPLESFTLYAPSTLNENDNDGTQENWAYLQSFFADILRSQPSTPVSQHLELRYDCGEVDTGLLNTVSSSVEQLTLRLKANSTRVDYGALSNAIEDMPQLESLHIYGSSSEAICIKSKSLIKFSAYGFSPSEKLRIGILACPSMRNLSLNENIYELRPSCILTCGTTLESLVLHVDWREEEAHVERDMINELSETLQRLPKLRELFLIGYFVDTSLQLSSESLESLDCRGCIPRVPLRACVCPSLKRSNFYYDHACTPRLFRQFTAADVAEIDENGFLELRVEDRGSDLLRVPDSCRFTIHSYDGIVQPIVQRFYR